MTTDRRGTAAAAAHAHIRAEIVEGRLSPGTMLSENELAASLAMSRTPVRAALARLQEEGWVTIYPQRGALVRQLTPQEIAESAQVRCALETAGVQYAAIGQRQALARPLGDSLARQESALSGGDFGAFTELAQEFHRAFAALGGNELMIAMYDRIQDRQHLSIVRSAPHITARPSAIVDEHRLLLAHCLAGDWPAFGRALRGHHEVSNDLETARPDPSADGSPHAEG